ncbi:SDR family oxidoreductase [Paludibaculum fermentans]|uniref:SDR family oxidoreductase n=1 Tax=Paludibaculum fermentans TaxID=1473598 RepID=UPI003EC08E6A
MDRAEARVLDASEIAVGLKASFERQVTGEDVENFATLSGDHNPLHTDESYAGQTNYGRRIVHGAFQIGLASTMVGMHLPGRNVVVGSMRSRFPTPLFFPSNVIVQGEITTWLPQAGNGTVRVRVIESSQSILTAEIHVGFSLHENRQKSVSTGPSVAKDTGLPVVVLTGAGSSIGLHLLQRLSSSYHVLGLVRSRSRTAELLGENSAELVECDLMNEDWESAADAALGDRPVCGLIHAAWPGAPQGGLLGLDAETVSRQVEFGTLTTIRLARWLVRHTRDSGRMVVLGTTAATIKPALNLAAYSLGKAAMEQTVRLLAPELAGKGISINAVLPSFMPQGMNNAKTRHAVLTETAKVPLGRLCTPADIAGSIEYLLSESGAFMTGQILPLTGGQL